MSNITQHKFTSYLTKHYSTKKQLGLDIGCRQRPYDDLYQCKYIGIDLPSSVSYADNIKPDIFATGEFLPFKDDTFDFVSCYSVVPYVKNVDGFFDEMYRIMQSTGIAVIIIMNIKGLNLQPETNFEQRYSSKDLQEKLNAHNFISIKHKNPKTFFLSTYYDKMSVYAYAIVKPKK